MLERRRNVFGMMDLIITLKRFISVVLVISLLSLCSCNSFDNDNDSVLDAATKYADAVINLDTDAIIDCMLDGEEYEEEINEYTSISSSAICTEICDVIIDSLEYEIDENSIRSSKGNGLASAEITITLLDYRSIYEEVFDDGGDINDYIDALRSNATVKCIEQTILFVYEDESWKVKDSSCCGLFEVYSFIPDVEVYSRRRSFEPLTVDEFVEALEMVYDVDEESIGYNTRDNYVSQLLNDDIFAYEIASGSLTVEEITPSWIEYAVCEVEGCRYEFYVYEGDASDHLFMDVPSDNFWEVTPFLLDDEFDYSLDYWNGHFGGYYLVNGDGVTCEEEWGGISFDVYGGIYAVGNSLVMFETIVEDGADDNTDITNVNAFLDAIGYPYP